VLQNFKFPFTPSRLIWHFIYMYLSSGTNRSLLLDKLLAFYYPVLGA